MKSKALDWWAARTGRERTLLLLLAALALPILVWLAVVRPLAIARETAEARLSAAAASYADTAMAAAELGRVRKAAGALSGPLPTPKDAAEAAGFPVKAASGGELILEAVRPKAFFAWAAQMEGKGLTIETLQASPNPDRTLRIEIRFRVPVPAQRQ
jgi:general secretion pathway protein M